MNNQSENINELAAALAKAQGEMQAAIKDCINPFFQSKYADLGSVWDAARPVLSKNGLCIMQTTDIMGEKIIMVTTLAHTSGQWMKSQLPLNPAKADSQGIGAAITYLRRYSLSALVGVVCDDDDDGETAVGRGTVKKDNTESKRTVTISVQQAEEIGSLIPKLDEENKKDFFKKIKEMYGAQDVKDIPALSFDRCLATINARLKLMDDGKRKVA